MRFVQPALGKHLAVVALAALLASCGASAPIPDVAYYRLPPAATAGAARAQPPLAEPILVDTFLADGMHGEQAILYDLKGNGSVKAYHYQLWNDPPVRLLQRRLIKRLRDEGLTSGVVADRLPLQIQALRVGGLIERFERVKSADGWNAVVRLELRVDRTESQLPVLLKTYESTQRADGESIQATIRAFAAAIDDAFGQFVADFAAAPPAT